MVRCALWALFATVVERLGEAFMPLFEHETTLAEIFISPVAGLSDKTVVSD